MPALKHRARSAMQERERRERVEAKPWVCRRLFQDEEDENDQPPGTEDNLTNRFSEEVRKRITEASIKYNFDFVNERPLPGTYQWVRPGEDFPTPPDESHANEEVEEGEGNGTEVGQEKSENLG